ncbi:MAG: hypothetical protein AAFX81_07285 [Pseudomonadota bacterium]
MLPGAWRGRAAGAAFVAALLLAGTATLTALTADAPAPPSVVVVVPEPPVVQEAAADRLHPDTAEETVAGATPAVEEARQPTITLPTAPTPGVEPPIAEASTAEASVPRLVVVATGVAWNESLAATADAALPKAVAFALPYDLPRAADSADLWLDAGREVLVRAAVVEGVTVAEATAVGLDDDSALQGTRLRQQLASHPNAVGLVVAEPAAAAELDGALEILRGDGRWAVLEAARGPAPVPAAWRIDAATLNEDGFERALSALVETAHRAPPAVALIEVYPGLVDDLANWLDAATAEGITLASVGTLRTTSP